MTLALVDRIRALPREQRLALYRSLEPGTLASQRYSPELWARPGQLPRPPEELATIEVYRGGRGAGKTLGGVWLFNREIESGRAVWPRIIAATRTDLVKVVIDGPSGIRTWLPPHRRPTWTGSRDGGTLTYPNGVNVVCCSAHEPGDAIGQGCDLTLADDPAKWVEKCGEARASAAFLQARVSNREGPRPCMIVPTTRRGVSFLRRLLTPGQIAGVHITPLGTARDNTALSAAYLRDTIADLDGDDWAAEELNDLDRDDAPGALWKRAWIDAHRVDRPPAMRRVCIAVDPADSGKHDADETGIVVVGLGEDGRLYVLADYTARWEAEHWAAIVAWAYRHHHADAVVAETNRARSMVRQCLRIELPNVAVIEVDAKKGKDTRAEPLTLLYRDGQVSHVRSGPQLSRPGPVRIEVLVYQPATSARLPVELVVQRARNRWGTLEDELCGWVPRGSRSPNGLDALVYACWHLRPPDGEGGAWEPAAGALQGLYGEADPRRGAVDPRSRLSAWKDRRAGRP